MPSQLWQDPGVHCLIKGIFLGKYLAASNTGGWPLPGNYVVEVIAVLSCDWLLGPAVQSMCFTGIRRIQKDARLAQQWYLAYALTLKRLQFAVSRSGHPSVDAALATAKMLNPR